VFCREDFALWWLKFVESAVFRIAWGRVCKDPGVGNQGLHVRTEYTSCSLPGTVWGVAFPELGLGVWHMNGQCGPNPLRAREEKGV
jgi:hypothetical protein